jgi:hypothetical protein
LYEGMFFPRSGCPLHGQKSLVQNFPSFGRDSGGE